MSVKCSSATHQNSESQHRNRHLHMSVNTMYSCMTVNWAFSLRTIPPGISEVLVSTTVRANSTMPLPLTTEFHIFASTVEACLATPKAVYEVISLSAWFHTWIKGEKGLKMRSIKLFDWSKVKQKNCCLTGSAIVVMNTLTAVMDNVLVSSTRNLYGKDAKPQKLHV